MGRIQIWIATLDGWFDPRLKRIWWEWFSESLCSSAGLKVHPASTPTHVKFDIQGGSRTLNCQFLLSNLENCCYNISLKIHIHYKAQLFLEWLMSHFDFWLSLMRLCHSYFTSLAVSTSLSHLDKIVKNHWKLVIIIKAQCQPFVKWLNQIE